MKKTISLQLIALLSVITILFVNCSKENLADPQSTPINKVQVHSPAVAPADEPGPGSIDMRVLPEKAMAYVVAYNDYYRSALFFADENGYVRLLNLPAGIYSLRIRSTVPNLFKETVINDIRVNNDETINLGETTLLMNQPSDNNPNDL